MTANKPLVGLENNHIQTEKSQCSTTGFQLKVLLTLVCTDRCREARQQLLFWKLELGQRMSGHSKPKQYVATMHEAFQYVQREWDAAGKVIAGDRGFCAVHVQSVRKSHPCVCAVGEEAAVRGSCWMLVTVSIGCIFHSWTIFHLSVAVDMMRGIREGHSCSLGSRNPNV